MVFKNLHIAVAIITRKLFLGSRYSDIKVRNIHDFDVRSNLSGHAAEGVIVKTKSEGGWWVQNAAAIVLRPRTSLEAGIRRCYYASIEVKIVHNVVRPAIFLYFSGEVRIFSSNVRIFSSRIMLVFLRTTCIFRTNWPFMLKLIQEIEE